MEKSPIENWVTLELGQRKMLHFSDHGLARRTIVDAITGREKEVDTLVFQVDEEDGTKVSKTYSVVSQKLASELAAYLPDKRYTGYVFTIEKPLNKFSPPRIAEARPI